MSYFTGSVQKSAILLSNPPRVMAHGGRSRPTAVAFLTRQIPITVRLLYTRHSANASDFRYIGLRQLYKWRKSSPRMVSFFFAVNKALWRSRRMDLSSLPCPRGDTGWAAPQSQKHSARIAAHRPENISLPDWCSRRKRSSK